MKKIICFLLLVCWVFSITACGSLPEGLNFGSGRINLETTSVTVYDTWTGESWSVTDDELVEKLRKVSDTSEWKALTGLDEQISAEPNYAIDLENGTCFGLLGDGYVLVGTAFEYISEEQFRIVDGKQYEVPVEFTDLLEEMTVR